MFWDLPKAMQYVSVRAKSQTHLFVVSHPMLA